MKFFYVGMQRCGTKSFGDFFRKNGFSIFSWKQIRTSGISDLWFQGKWNQIIDSGIFDEYDVFEDGPFSDPSFAAFLSNSIPDSRFVYFERPAEDWYKSMVTHSAGLTPGHLMRHAYVYDRLEECDFIEQQSGELPSKLSIIGMKSHYEAIYKRHKHQMVAKLRHLNDDNVFFGHLYDGQKFEKMSSHFGLEFADTSEQMSHKTPHTVADVISHHQYLFA